MIDAFCSIIVLLLNACQYLIFLALKTAGVADPVATCSTLTNFIATY